MSKLAQILKDLMARYGITETELARRTNIGQPVIHRMASGETDNPKVGTLSPIANLFSINISQLVGASPLPARLPDSLPNSVGQGWEEVPLLSLEQAVLWPGSIDHYHVRARAHTDAYISDDAFAVRLKDDTMCPRFPSGTLAVFDPNLKPKDKDFALVHIEGQPQATFKQVLHDGDDVYLKPLNKDFSPQKMLGQFKYLGVMVQARSNYVDAVN